MWNRDGDSGKRPNGSPGLLSPEAETHLTELEDYIAHVSYVEAAAKYIRRLTKACFDLGLAPHRGQRHDDIRPGMRTVGFERRATILFEVGKNEVLILGIFYGGRSLPLSPP